MFFLLISALLTSCDVNENFSEEYKNQYLTYESAIQSIDSSLKITISSTTCQDGHFIVIYSIESPSESTFAIRLECITAKKTELMITFDDARNYWDEYNKKLLVSFIELFTTNKIEEGIMKNKVDEMIDTNYIRLNRYSSLSWDEYNNLFYSEKLIAK